MNRRVVTLFTLSAVLPAVGVRVAGSGQAAETRRPASITIDYPLEGSLFPPEITSPSVIWHDASATSWRIEVAFGDGSPGMQFRSEGEQPAIGEIDPRCGSDLSDVMRARAGAHGWAPPAGAWETIKKHSVAAAATVTIRGYNAQDAQHAVSSGVVRIRTSSDPVGAPIFYRDVPLMPSETEKGIIKPLAPNALPLVQWRIRDLAKPESRVVLKDMPTCGNCHSFSLDGKTMGMDLDGPANNKGLYAIVGVTPEISIRNQDVISWSSLPDEAASASRIGFMSQVSPDGKYVLTNFRGQTQELANGYFTVNFKDFRFLQVFYPTRSIVAWYDRATGRKHPLPGADDPRYVQTNAVWSPDGKYVVFARAGAKDPYPPGNRMPQHANDPEEPQIQYDLYWVPFNGGKGGEPAPIRGASHNGMSNSFPKVSPDGRWIVWVQCRNAMLMRPDSQLYIVPAPGGGVARRLRANTPLMNSWHSFSPNGRWLVFSSKSRSPYTQMFLTHIDAEGNDTPAILIENSTAANRAVNIPEFVNIPPDGLKEIRTPAVDVYKEIDRLAALEEKGQLEAAIAGWRKALATNPGDARILNHLGTALSRAGRPAEAIPEFEKALAADPEFLRAYFNLGRAYLVSGSPEKAIVEFQKGLRYDSQSADLHYLLGLALASQNRVKEAKAEFDRTLELNPNNANAHTARGFALTSEGEVEAAMLDYREALRLDPSSELAHVNLGALLNGTGNIEGAIAEYRAALKRNPNNKEAHAVLGGLLARKGDLDGAIGEDRAALQLDPDYETAHFDLGAALGAKGDWDGAIREYREALRLNPDDGKAHYNLGISLGYKSDWDGAIAEERQALRVDPKNEDAHAILGFSLGHKGDWAGAAAEQREALRLDPKNASAHFGLGMALEAESDWAGALREYQAAYELRPEMSDFREAYQRVLKQTSH
jgi:tetratricopeptide (TPR) repeat protein